MKKIITALAEPQLNNELKKEKDFIVIGKDIQYQEGVIEILETEKEVDFLIISETLPGNEKIESLIEKIKQINNEVNIVIILENKKEELEKNLYSKNVYLTFDEGYEARIYGKNFRSIKTKQCKSNFLYNSTLC